MVSKCFTVDLFLLFPSSYALLTLSHVDCNPIYTRLYRVQFQGVKETRRVVCLFWEKNLGTIIKYIYEIQFNKRDFKHGFQHLIGKSQVWVNEFSSLVCHILSLSLLKSSVPWKLLSKFSSLLQLLSQAPNHFAKYYFKWVQTSLTQFFFHVNRICR